MAQTSPSQMVTDNRETDAVKEQQRSSNLARIRDNQRRSRARRKEYLEELEGKLRSCQQLGIEASAEIQAAARRVVDENKRLRQLLKRQGFSDAEIDGLTADESPEPPSRNTSAGALEGMLSTRKACGCEDEPSITTSSSGNMCLPSTSPENLTFPPPSSSASIGQEAYLDIQPQPHLLPRPPIPVNFQNFNTSSSQPLQFPSHSHTPSSTHQIFPSSFPPSFSPDLGFDEPTGWLMNFDQLPAASSSGGDNTVPGSPMLSLGANDGGNHHRHNSSRNSSGGGGNNNNSSNVSSCVAAADLIRTIKPDIALEELERELGCAHGGECKVPLAQILTIMAKVGSWGGGIGEEGDLGEGIGG